MKKLLISAIFFGAAINLHAQKIVVTKSTVDVGKRATKYLLQPFSN